MFKEVIEKAKSMGANEILDLVEKIRNLLVKESQEGKGKLKEKIDLIKEKASFVDQNIIYLPPKGKVTIVGDLHGDFETLAKILANFSDDYLIFLGDYVDRGQFGVEVLNTTLLAKLNYPEKVFLLRGNHEDLRLNDYYGFVLEVKLKFPNQTKKLLKSFGQLYEVLPSILVTGNSLVAVHGGVPRQKIETLSDLNDLDILYEIRWNDPNPNIRGFGPSVRGGGIYTFGQDVFFEFLESISGKVLVRSHEPEEAGYRLLFGNKLLTIFSTTAYGLNAKPYVLRVDLSKSIDRFSQKMIYPV